MVKHTGTHMTSKIYSTCKIPRMSLDKKHARVARIALAVAALIAFGIIIWFTFRGFALEDEERPSHHVQL
jgi:ABC-type uncharacterized transport system permease subunit